MNLRHPVTKLEEQTTVNVKGAQHHPRHVPPVAADRVTPHIDELCQM